MAKIQCCTCKDEREAKAGKSVDAKLPPGWKRHGGPPQIWCQECWGKAFVLRAVTIPVATIMDGEWGDFFDVLKSSWKDVTDISNWAVTEMARNDTPRTADQKKLCVKPKLYLYPGARKVAPNLDTSSVVAVLHAVEGRYRNARLHVLWNRSESFPAYKYPCPLPIHNQSWSCAEGDGGRHCISVRLGGRRWTLALSTARHRRQLSAWRAILNGVAVPGELALIGQEVTKSDHRRHGEDRTPGGGRRKSLRVMAKMVAWFPRTTSKEREGTLYVWSSGDHLLNYRIGVDGFIRRIDALHVRRWVAEHRRKIRAMSNDLKHEKRWPRKLRLQMTDRLELWTRKQRDRINSFTHEASKILAAFAERYRVADVVYDDNVRTFVDSFPWASLKSKLQYKLAARSIVFTEARIQEREDGDGEAPGESVAVAGDDLPRMPPKGRRGRRN